MNNNGDKNSKKPKVNQYGDVISSDNINGENIDAVWDFTNPNDRSFESIDDTQAKNEVSKIEDYLNNSDIDYQKIARLPNSLKISLCAALGISYALVGGAIGSVFGTFQGITQGVSSQLHRQPTQLARFTMQCAFSNGVSFGMWLGCYSSVKCTSGVMRNKDDALNAFFGGSVAGALSSIRSRSAPLIIASGLSGGVLMAIMHSFTK